LFVTTFAMSFTKLVLCVALGSAVWADQIVVTPNITVNFQGQSGSVTVWRTSDTQGSTSVTLGFDAIEEWNSNNQTLSPPVSIKLATQTFTWSTPVIVNFQGYNATELTLTSTLSNGAAFKVTAYIFFEDAVVTHGNITYIVLTDHCKLTFDVSKWPFQSMSDYLLIAVDLKFKGGAKGNPTSVDDKGDGKQKKVVFGGGELDVANTALIDGVSKPVTSQIFTKQSGKNTFVGVQFQFPAFQNSLDYDPSLMIGASFATSPSMLLAFASAMICFVASRVQ